MQGDSCPHLVIASPVDVPSGDAALPTKVVEVWPNPFAGEASLRVNFPKRAHARLEIFNAEGRRVRTLFDGSLELGLHEISWNATGMPAGIYYYRLATDDVTKAGQLTLVR